MSKIGKGCIWLGGIAIGALIWVLLVIAWQAIF